MADEREVLNGWEKLGLIAIIGALFILRTYDARPLVDERLADIEYAAFAGDFAITVVEIYFLLRINHFLKRIFALFASTLRGFGWVQVKASAQAQTQAGETVVADNGEEIHIRTEASTRAAPRGKGLSEEEFEGWLRDKAKREETRRIMAAIAFVLGSIAFFVWIIMRVPSEEPNPADVTTEESVPVACGPTYCAEEDGVWSCAIPSGSSPWQIALALYGTPDRAREIFEINEPGLAGRTDRQIPVGYRLRVPSRPSACED